MGGQRAPCRGEPTCTGAERTVCPHLSAQAQTWAHCQPPGPAPSPASSGSQRLPGRRVRAAPPRGDPVLPASPGLPRPEESHPVHHKRGQRRGVTTGPAAASWRQAGQAPCRTDSPPAPRPPRPLSPAPSWAQLSTRRAHTTSGPSRPKPLPLPPRKIKNLRALHRAWQPGVAAQGPARSPRDPPPTLPPLPSRRPCRAQGVGFI